jgi:hypothetical protein
MTAMVWRPATEQLEIIAEQRFGVFFSLGRESRLAAKKRRPSSQPGGGVPTRSEVSVP